MIRRPQAAEAADRAVLEARKQLDNLPGADGGRRPILLKQLSAARIEQAARYLALEAARTTPTTAKDRERLDSGIDGTQLAVRDLTSLGGADGKELIKAAQRNLQLLHLRRGKLRAEDWPRLTQACEQLSRAPIFIDDNGGGGAGEPV